MKLKAIITAAVVAMLLSAAPAWAQAAQTNPAPGQPAATAPANVNSSTSSSQSARPGARGKCGVQRMGGGHHMKQSQSMMSGNSQAKMACCHRKGSKMAKGKSCCRQKKCPRNKRSSANKS